MLDPHSHPASVTADSGNPGAGRQGHGLIWWVVILVIGGAGVLWWRHQGTSSAATPAAGGRRGGAFGPVVISTAMAHRGEIGIYVNALGTVTPLKTVSINSRIQGQIVAVKYQEGQMVQAGDPLIEIDPGPSQAALTQAEGQLKRDSAILENARLDMARYQEAYASNAIPKQQLDTQVATVEQDEGTVKLDQGLLDNARVQLQYCHITAPISGRVGLRLVDEGNMAQASSSTALAVITQLQPSTVIFNVAEDDLPPILEQVRAGKTLPVDAFDRAQTKKLASGELETLDNEIALDSGTVKCRALFANADEALFPNQFVNVRLLVKTLSNATLLPNAAIQRNAEGAFVYVVKPDAAQDPAAATNHLAATPGEPTSRAGAEGASTNAASALAPATVSMQTITVSTTDGNVSAVEGLAPGTVVAADSFSKLTDGAKVMVRPGGGGAGAGGGAGSGRSGGHKPGNQQKPASE